MAAVEDDSSGASPYDPSKDPNNQPDPSKSNNSAYGSITPEQMAKYFALFFGDIPDDAILPRILPSIWPGVQSSFGNWLLGQIGQGVPGYTGQMTASPTALQQKAWDSWQPWDAGTMYMASMLNGGFGIGQKDPMLDNMMKWGGTGGPGNQAMSNLMQFGTPSEAGRYAANMAQYGISSEGAGRPLVDLAYGKPVASSEYLMPFLLGGSASKYNYSSPSYSMENRKRG